MDKRQISKMARQVRRALGSQPNFTNLSAYINNLGWQIFLFNNENDAIIRQLELKEYIRHKDAFSQQLGQTKLIFMRENLPPDMLPRLLAHEIGHILLGHISTDVISPAACVQQEAEAAYFADKLLKPPNHLRRNILIFAFVLMLAVFPVLAAQLNDTSADQLAAPEVTAAPIAGEYYITASGRSYHTADCYHIRDRQVMAITKAAAENMGYAPCKDCVGK